MISILNRWVSPWVTNSNWLKESKKSDKRKVYTFRQADLAGKDLNNLLKRKCNLNLTLQLVV
jgi:hypothetical protein